MLNVKICVLRRAETLFQYRFIPPLSGNPQK